MKKIIKIIRVFVALTLTYPILFVSLMISLLTLNLDYCVNGVNTIIFIINGSRKSFE
jgi:hypothetical protein